MKIAIIGAGSTYTPEIVKGLLDIKGDVDIDTVCFHDIDDRKLETLYGFSKRLAKGAFDIVKTKSFEDCVRDASYVIFQFRPGGLEGRLKDETIPLKYGLIGQETTGIGGFAMAMRAFPIVERYLETVDKFGKAFVINFTNPSGHITEFVLNYLRYERFVGLCNIPINLLQAIADFFGVERNDVFLKYYGLNHLSFVEKVYVKGEDVTEEVMGRIIYTPSNISQGLDPKLISEVGLLMSPYMKYYLYEKKTVEELKKNKPRAEVVMEIERKLLKEYERSSEVPPELSKRGGSMYSTAAALLLKALHTSSGEIHIVNTRNEGAVTNLPGDYVIELPTLVKAGRVFPVSLGRAREFALGFIHPVKMYERLAIEAYLRGSKKLAKEALLVHPLGPDADVVDELLDDLINAHSLPLR